LGAYYVWIWEFNYRPGSRRLVSDPAVFSGNRGTGSLQHGSADYWIGVCASASRPGTIFDVWEGCLGLLLMRSPSFAGMLMQLIFASTLVSLGRVFRLAATSSGSTWDFTQLIVAQW